MELLKLNDTLIPSGGNPIIVAEAIALGVGLFVAPYEIGAAIGQDWSYPTIGGSLGEFIFDIRNPDPLGQMTFNAFDFGRP